MSDMEFEKFMQWSRAKIWRDVQQEVRNELDKLRNAYPYDGHPKKNDILKAHDAKIQEHFKEFFSDDFASLLDKIDNEPNPEARRNLIVQSIEVSKQLIGPLKKDPFIDELEANPFVKLSIRGTINRANKQLSFLRPKRG
jgi:hypothetical protein